MAQLPLLSPLERALFLKAQRYLSGLAPRAIAALAEYTDERSFAKGEVLFSEGEPPDRIYFLSRGAVQTRYPGAASFDLEAPGGVGMVELLAMSETPPRVTALENTATLSLGVVELLALLEDDFIFYETFARGLSEVLREAAQGSNAQQRSEPGFGAASGAETDVTYVTMDLVHRIARARQTPFFRDCSLTVLTQLLRFEEPAQLAAGQTLWQRGDTASSLALVLDGEFETQTEQGDATPHPAGAVLAAWDVFGADARLETCVATTPARVLQIDRNLFTDVLEDHFEFARDYLAKLSRRLIALRYSALSEGSDTPMARDSESSGSNASPSSGSGNSSNGNGMRDSL